MVCAGLKCCQGCFLQKFSNKNLCVCVCVEDLQVSREVCACGSMPVLCVEIWLCVCMCVFVRLQTSVTDKR